MDDISRLKQKWTTRYPCRTLAGIDVVHVDERDMWRAKLIRSDKEYKYHSKEQIDLVFDDWRGWVLLDELG